MTKIIESDINEIMLNSYETYATEVIKDRALPDVRDGLKPVRRRIIYSAYELGLENNKPYKKSARLVGEVLGKYHPHGDSSVYGAAVRLAQDFSMRYPLLDGHGNFGSVDGDSAASMRYTEIRQQKIFSELIKDINKNAVEFIPNFDGEEKEPSILPGLLPNLLINGSSGIAVGFATNIPPHNISEVVDGIIYQIDNPDCTIKELVKYIKAPDFPTGGIIINLKDIEKIYQNGEGAIKLRAKYSIETINGKENIVISEIPYQINKTKLIESIYSLSQDQKIKDKKTGKDKIIKAKIPDINKVRDESDRDGMRIVIELKKKNTNQVLNLLFKHTDLQINYNVNMTAMNGRELLENISLKNMIKYYIEHQTQVIYNVSEFDLKKSKKRIILIEGLIKALNDIDKSIELIKSSSNKSVAKNKLIKYLTINDEQAEYILSLQLSRLTGIEIDTIKNEYAELNKTIEKLTKIINDKKEILKVLKKELIRLKVTYGDNRKTQIIEDNVKDTAEIPESDLIEDYNCYISVSKENYLYKYLRRTDNFKLKDNDEIIKTESTSNKATLLIFTSLGNCHKLFLHDIQEKLPSQLGHYLPSLINLQQDEKIISVQVTRKYMGDLINIFENGKLARIKLESFKTEQKRSQLKNAISTESPLINQFIITDDIDIICKSSIDKVLITSTSQFNAKGSKNTNGDGLIKSKNDSTLVFCQPLDNIDKNKLDVECYRGNRNAVGSYLKKEHSIQLLTK